MASLRTVIVPALFAAALVSGTDALAQARPTLPIAYISVQRILNEAEDAKTAAKELEALRAAKAQELNAKKRELDNTKLQIANAGGMFSTSKRQQLTEQAKRQESELQQATQQAQTDFQELQKKVQDRLRQELGAIINTLAQQRGVQYVLNQDVAIVLAPTGANWTAEVLQRLNAVTAAQKSAPEKTPEKGASAPKTP
jgi:Skp family chaperone for outer membrane proteins